MRLRSFILIALLVALLFSCASEAKVFSKFADNIYEEKGGKTLFHVFAGGQQVCTFENGSPLAGGTDTNKVGYYYHEDNLNSSSALSGSSGSQQEVNVYYPFGRAQTANPQASFQVSRRFTGQIFDAEIGLYWYDWRIYVPELGRFGQADTIIPDLSNPQSYNRYSYCVNNPLRYTDPDGHSFWSATSDALSSTETFSSSYHLMVMHDSAGWKAVEIPVAIGGMAVATADTLLNVASVGVKGAAEATGKELLKAGAEELGKEGEKVGAKAAKDGAEAAGTDAKAAKKQVGSYTNHHESGKTYDGKGSKERSQTSAKRVEDETGDAHTATEFTHAKNDREAFKQESQRLDGHGGSKSENNYNKIDSPGKKMREQDGVK
jgi:RHS repeat-associated protein